MKERSAEWTSVIAPPLHGSLTPLEPVRHDTIQERARGPANEAIYMDTRVRIDKTKLPDQLSKNEKGAPLLERRIAWTDKERKKALNAKDVTDCRALRLEVRPDIIKPR